MFEYVFNFATIIRCRCGFLLLFNSRIPTQFASRVQPDQISWNNAHPNQILPTQALPTAAFHATDLTVNALSLLLYLPFILDKQPPARDRPHRVIRAAH